MPEKPQYMDAQQVADSLLVSPWTVRRWVAEGRLNAKRLPGGRLRFITEDIEKFLAEEVVEPVDDPSSHSGWNW